MMEPMDDCCWSPPTIRVPGVNGNDIEVMDVFCYDKDEVVLRPGEVIFPPDKYPPQWEQRSTITNAIRDAALLQSNTELIVLGTEPKKNTVIIGCNKGRRFYCKDKGVNPTSDEVYHTTTNPFEPVDGNIVAHIPTYAKDIKLDRMVNKDKARRPGGNKGHARRFYTSKPPLEKICHFKMRVKLMPGKYWYIKKTTKLPNGVHNHIFYGKDGVVRRRATLERQTLENNDRYFRHANGGAATGLVNEETDGFTMSQQQLRRTARDREVIDTSGSPASRLIAELKRKTEEGTHRYVALYHEVTETTLLSVTKIDEKRLKKKQTMAQQEAATSLLELSQAEPNDPELAEEIELEVTGSLLPNNPAGNQGEQKSPFKLTTELDKLALGECLLPIRDRLQVGQRILLGVAWSREDERRLFDLFPEIMYVDVTMGTNDEGRPLALAVGTDGNMKVFTPVRAFLPSQCRWVFDWLFGTVFPTLLGREPLSRTQLVLTDGDSKEYGAFGDNQREFYPNAVHGLCIYHLVTKQINEILRRRLLNPDDPQEQSQVNTFKHWIFSWMRLGGVENEAEFQVSKDLLAQWLSSFQDSDSPSLKHNAVELEDFLTKTLLDHKSRWFFPGRAGCRTFNQKTTSPCEACNHTMKHKASKVVTPGMSLKESFCTQDTQCNNRMNEWERETMKAIQAHELWVTNSHTADTVNKMCESMLQQRYSQHKNYSIKVRSPTQIYVARRPGTAHAYCEYCDPARFLKCECCSDDSPIPCFLRLRAVQFLPIDNGHYFVVTCTCLYQSDSGIPCHHITKCFPAVFPHHIDIRFHRRYPALYKKKGFERETEEMKRRQRDKRIVITRHEYDAIMQYAHSPRNFAPDTDFMIPPLSYVQSNKFGLITTRDPRCKKVHLSAMDDSSSAVSENDCFSAIDSYDLGLLSQDVGLPDNGETDSPVRAKALYQSGNRHKDLVALLEVLSDRLKHDDELYDILYVRMHRMSGELHNLMDQKYRRKSDLEGEYVSPYASVVPAKQKFRRIRGAAEPKRKPKRKKQETILANSII
jgi:hypothetical protein